MSLVFLEGGGNRGALMRTFDWRTASTWISAASG
jgi:hypothetical protein